MGSPKVTAFPWHSLPRLTGRSVEARQRLTQAFDLAALPNVIREVTQLRVEDGCFTSVQKQTEAAGFARCTFRGPDFVLVVFLEPSLVARGLAATLGVETRLDRNAALSESLQAALQAVVQVVTRSVARAGCLAVLNEVDASELGSEPDLQTDFELRVQSERYWGRLAVYLTGVPGGTRAPRNEAKLSKLPVRLVAVAAVCRLRQAELSCLEPGDCVVIDNVSAQVGWVGAQPLEALWLAGVGSERALLVCKQGAGYVLEQIVSLPQLEAEPGSDEELYCRVSVEAGSLTLSVKQWRALKLGEAVTGFAATPGTCLLRVGERALAQGFLRRVGELSAFCVTARL